ncbi:zinc finger protein ZAT5-like [Zingiber officinale]|uniref:C2H2-type domain-containing protein n=1 Tax=Zingiber officinale TaxID=94328 RepID=A0A8J5H3T1_ZINOF|nr:zinc finger protein ZAT5-like [Zingiber officinale]KAG6509109.1 hypothetical protein ZIOFF_034500 [Zingiber officinale]
MEQSNGNIMAKKHVEFSPVVIKSKQTKRLRAAVSASSSSAESFSSSADPEEEVMARCLILLAQGRVSPPPSDSADLKSSSTAAAAGGGGRRFPSRECAYDCKTCGKSFRSFQALGGHRTRHKKPKDLPPPATAEDGGGRTLFTGSPKSPREHECAICRTSFSSGQALGGHMRRHRRITTAADEPAPPEAKKELTKNAFVLDLNLPAPSEDDGAEERQPVSPPPSSLAFPFENQQPLIFSSRRPWRWLITILNQNKSMP